MKVSQQPIFDIQMGSTGGRGLPMGYAIWEFKGNAWRLKKDCSVEGGVASEPPSLKGKFDGQLRVTPSITAGV